MAAAGQAIFPRVMAYCLLVFSAGKRYLFPICQANNRTEKTANVFQEPLNHKISHDKTFL
jgi:hypothetical protein